MLTTLISWGAIKIYTYGACLAVGIFLSLYAWWKMGRDEHLDEISLFDGYFLALVIYLISARASYVLWHWSELGTLYRSLAILAYPGFYGAVGILVSSLFLYLFSRARDWDGWRVADMFVVSLGMALIFGGLGSVFNGTSSIWYVNVWNLVWATITYGVVARVRKNFRFYAWYKGEASVAPDGLASLIFGGLVGVYYLGLGLMTKYWLAGLGFMFIVLAMAIIQSRIGKKWNLIQWLRTRRS